MHVIKQMPIILRRNIGARFENLGTAMLGNLRCKGLIEHQPRPMIL
jgi:hypothetical protein